VKEDDLEKRPVPPGMALAAAQGTAGKARLSLPSGIIDASTMCLLGSTVWEAKGNSPTSSSSSSSSSLLQELLLSLVPAKHKLTFCTDAAIPEAAALDASMAKCRMPSVTSVKTGMALATSLRVCISML